MRPHLDIKHEGSVGTLDRHRMSFDENSLAHLMSVLTDLYSNPILAFIREYSTNAWDSHVASDMTDVPIEIDLPNQLAPVFRVRDFGLGLSAQEVVDNLSKYGWSSKRDNDNETGMLGLGCKSALTYTSQFTYVVTKDRERSVVLVTRDDDGAGTVQIISTEATSEPNGVEVQIPVKLHDVKSVQRQARDFFYHWRPGTVKVDGRITDDNIFDQCESDTSGLTFKLDDDVYVRPSHSGELDGTYYIVMGGVTYSFLPATPDYMPNKSVVTAFVPIGSVNFTPSREDLADTKRTRDAKEAIVDFVEDRIAVGVARKLASMDKEKAHSWVLKNYTLIEKLERRGHANFFDNEGQRIPNSRYVHLPEDSYKISGSKSYGQDHATLAYRHDVGLLGGTHNGVNYLPLAIVTGYQRTKGGLRAPVKEVIREKVNADDSGWHSSILFLPHNINDFRLRDVPRFAYADLDAEARARTRQKNVVAKKDQGFGERCRVIIDWDHDRARPTTELVEQDDFDPEYYVTPATKSSDKLTVRRFQSMPQSASVQIAYVTKTHEKWFIEKFPKAQPLALLPQSTFDRLHDKLAANVSESRRARDHDCDSGACWAMTRCGSRFHRSHHDEVDSAVIRDLLRHVTAANTLDSTEDDREYDSWRHFWDRSGIDVPPLEGIDVVHDKTLRFMRLFPDFQKVLESVLGGNNKLLVKIINAMFPPVVVDTAFMIDALDLPDEDPQPQPQPETITKEVAA